MEAAEVNLSVIVPTRGRRSLRATLRSVVHQLEPGDEVLVRWSNDGDFGNSARQSLIERARGTHLAFIDDDDRFAPDAMATMRRAAAEHPLQGEPVFRDEVVAHVRSDARPLVRLGMKVTLPLRVLRYRVAPRTRLRRLVERGS